MGRGVGTSTETPMPAAARQHSSGGRGERQPGRRQPGSARAGARASEVAATPGCTSPVAATAAEVGPERGRARHGAVVEADLDGQPIA